MVYCPEYFEIIGNRLLNPITDGELHHIFPKSCGGSNKKSNLVMLTPAEHLRCHELLVGMFEDEPKNHQKMACAWHFTSHTRDGKKLTPEEYAAIREAHAKAVSEMLKGHEVSPEARRKISEKNLGRKDSEETRRKKSEGHKGLKHPNQKPPSPETCKKISAALKGKPSPNKGKTASPETRRLMSESHKGFRHTDETRAVMKAKRKLQAPPTKGKSWYHNETKSFLCFPDDPKVAELHLIPGRRR